MQKKRHSPEQLIAKLRAAEVDLATGIPIEQLCKQLEVSAATFHRMLHQTPWLTVRDLRSTIPAVAPANKALQRTGRQPARR